MIHLLSLLSSRCRFLAEFRPCKTWQSASSCRELRIDVFRELAEILGMGIGCSRKCQDRTRSRAGIDERHVRIGNQIIPVLDQHTPYLVVGIHIGSIQSDDFLFQTNLHSIKVSRSRILDGQFPMAGSVGCAPELSPCHPLVRRRWN